VSALDSTTPLPDAVVRYAPHDDGVIDLHLPAGTPLGTEVLVHGGFWRSEYDRRQTRPVADALRAHGWLVASPEYRRTGAGGGWPQTLTDVRDAVAALPGLLEGLGLPYATPLALVGHSAGGHLVLWLAAEGVPAARVVALAPVGDLRDAYDRDLDGGAVRALLGGAPEEVPERYAAADPAARLTEPSPLRGRIVVVHGTADRHVPVANSDWARAVAGVEVRLLDGVDHFAVMDPGSAAWPEVLAALD
jgi:acetyl esterase/lipase